MKAQERLARQWQMLAAISQTRRGLSLVELMGLGGDSRSTVYRDLKLMLDAGVPLLQESGRYRLLTERELPPAGFTALQIASLHLARLQLGPFEGAPLVVELDRLLGQLQRPAQQAFRFAPSRKPRPQPAILKTLERAHRYRKRASIEYRAASRGGAPATVHIEPLVFNVAEGDAYLLAYCVERDRESTYKISRISRASLTDIPSTHRPGGNPARAFAHSVKAWSGEPRRIRIRLDPSVAWLARDYALPDQTEATDPDGSVVVEATVAGLVEAHRRVLSWGGAAEVLEPPELRKAVRDDLAAALQRYQGPGTARARAGSSEKSTKGRKRRLTDRETRVG